MSRRPVKPKRRAEAVQLAAEVGAAEAGRRLGLPAATVRSWVHRSGGVSARGGRAPAVSAAAAVSVSVVEDSASGSSDPIVLAEGRARSSWSAASETIVEVRNATARGDALAARHFSAAFSVASDQAAKAERLLLDMQERRPRIEQAQISWMVMRLRGCLHELGLDPDRESRVVVAIKRWFAEEMPTVSGPRRRPVPDSEPVAEVEPEAPVVEDLTPIGVVPSESAGKEAVVDDAGTASEPEAAEVAERAAAAQAPRRVPNYTPLPRGWERGSLAPGGRGRGRGPAGRAGA